MTALTDCLAHDLLLQGIADVEKCMQNVYIMGGCDFVSFLRGYGKKSFFDSFRKNAAFICSNPEGDGCDGLCSFYKLMLCTYFSKHRAAFQPAVSVQELVTKLSSSDKSENFTLISVIKHFRENMWERVSTETDMLPNADALQLHWKRCMWVPKYWQQSVDSVMSLSPLTDFGWSTDDNILSVIWDTEANVKRVNDTIQWYTKGCSCKKGCLTNKCSCRRSRVASAYIVKMFNTPVCPTLVQMRILIQTLLS